MSDRTSSDRTSEPLTFKGRRLDYRWIEGTDPTAPTLVFLHEGLGSISLWRDFPDQVAAATGAPTLIYSRLGHGRSDPPLAPRDLDYLHREALDVLPAVLAHFGIDSPILIGHSDGASIALIHAAAADRPVRGVIVEAPHSFVEPITLAGIRGAVEAARTTDLLQKLGRHHDDTEALFRAWSGVWLTPPFADWNIEDLLPKITCPTLVIQGEGDEYGTPRQVHAVTERVSGPAEGLLLPDCGHTPHRDQAEAVLNAIARFILGLRR